MIEINSRIWNQYKKKKTTLVIGRKRITSGLDPFSINVLHVQARTSFSSIVLFGCPEKWIGRFGIWRSSAAILPVDTENEIIAPVNGSNNEGALQTSI